MTAPRSFPPKPGFGPRRLQKTFADYLGIAVGPVLIMVLVGSLNFFLLEIGYRGAFSGQVYWTIFWFTVASVLVSRISIEQGASYGSLYGLALGAATGLRLCQFLGAPWSALLLLASIWWCASKLVWDCTLIDDDVDASGEGLLQRTGLDPASATGTQPGAGSRRFPWISWFTREAPAHSARPDPEPSEGAARRAHAPGVWVIYFALAGLPVFGLGQWLLPEADTEARRRGFLLAMTFAASALGLLLVTSFLGLRRYLRQRRLTMPPAIARAWMGLGATMLLAVILGAAFLPRPRGFETLAHLGLGYRERPQKASSHALHPGEAAEGPGRAIGKPGSRPGSSRRDARDAGNGTTSGRDDSPGTGRSESGKSGADAGDNASEGKSDTGDGGDPSSAETQGRSGQGRTGSGATSRPSSSESPGLPAEVPGALRWLSYALALVVAALVLWRFGPAWLRALRAARAQKPKGASSRPVTAPPRRAFAEFADPFATGRADAMSPDELASYTFAALEAWAADTGRPRSPDETPLEFGRHLAERTPELSDTLNGAVRVYVRAAYSELDPEPDALEHLRRLWLAMRRG